MFRDHFLRSGAPKRSFESQGECQHYLAAKGWTRRYGYHQCSLCGKWHLHSHRDRRIFA